MNIFSMKRSIAIATKILIIYNGLLLNEGDVNSSKFVLQFLIVVDVLYFH